MDGLDLTPFFKTKAEATDFIVRLSAISEKVYGTKFNLENELLNQYGMHKKDKFITLLREREISPDNTSALKEFIDSLRDYAVKLPVLSLTLAFEPKEKTLEVLSEWFSLNNKQQLLLDITVDPSIIGGTIITFHGKFLDFSIQPKVKELLTQLTTQTPVSSITQIPMPTTAVPTASIPTAHQNLEHLHLGR